MSRYLVAARKDGEAPVISKANMRFDFERTKCAHATTACTRISGKTTRDAVKNKG